MSHLKKFRVINEIERKMINDSLLKISPQILSDLVEKDSKFYISLSRLNSRDNFPSVYFVPNNLSTNLDNFNPETIINSAGLYFGFIKKSQFFLSLEGAEFLYKSNVIPQKLKVILNDKGEKAILYGNKILKKFAPKIPTTLKKNNLLFVFNKSKELISIARSQVNYSEYQENLSPNDIFAINLVDKGYYLRKKQ